MAFDAGTAVLKVVADAKGLGQSVATEVRTTESAVSGATSRLSSTIKTGLTLGFAAAGTAAIKFAADAVASASEAEQVQTALANAVGGSTEAYESQATALQNLTGFQDEEILKADTVLARFGLTENQLKQLTPLVLDYARATGKDATSAAESIGKALLGNTRALKEIGIAYKSTGDTAEDFTNIVGLLDEQVGGAAEAFGGTYAGQVAILAAKFDDLKESVGERLLGPLGELLSVVEAILGPTQVAADNMADLNEELSKLPEDIAVQFIARADEINATLETQQRVAMLASEQQAALATETDLATEAMKEQQQAVKSAANELPGLIGAILRLKEAQKELRAAQDDTSTSTADLRDKQLAVIDAFLGVKGAFADIVDKYREGGGTMKDVIDQFRATAEQAGLSKGAIEDLVGVVRRYIRSLNDIPNEVVTNVRTNYSHQQLAEGGIVTRPTFALIGEAGPEAVIPLDRAGSMAKGGDGWGSGDIVIQIDGREVFRAVRDQSIRTSRNNVSSGIG